MTKIESGNIEFESVPFSLRDGTPYTPLHSTLHRHHYTVHTYTYASNEC